MFSGILTDKAYDFLREDPYLGENVILLGYGGSHSYGTNVPGSDIDVRGIAREPVSCILGSDRFEQVNDDATDTVVYGLRKVAGLLANCNPNVVELLGLREQDYLYMTPVGEKLLANKDMFFSRAAQFSFGGYATAQLRRLQNALAHDAYPQAEKNRHILGSLENTIHAFNDRYRKGFSVNVRLDANHDIVVDMDVKGYPMRDAYGMFSEMKSVIREYDKLNHRNTKKDDAHLNKHAMHLLRLLMTGEELLRTGQIHTYRDKEHDLLLSVRNGDYQLEDHTFRREFFEMVDEWEKKFQYAAKHSVLPESPDRKRIAAFVEEVNLETVQKRVHTDTKARLKPKTAQRGFMDKERT